MITSAKSPLPTKSHHRYQGSGNNTSLFGGAAGEGSIIQLLTTGSTLALTTKQPTGSQDPPAGVEPTPAPKTKGGKKGNPQRLSPAVAMHAAATGRKYSPTHPHPACGGGGTQGIGLDTERPPWAPPLPSQLGPPGTTRQWAREAWALLSVWAGGECQDPKALRCGMFIPGGAPLTVLRVLLLGRAGSEGLGRRAGAGAGAGEAGTEGGSRRGHGVHRGQLSSSAGSSGSHADTPWVIHAGAGEEGTFPPTPAPSHCRQLAGFPHGGPRGTLPPRGGA